MVVIQWYARSTRPNLKDRRGSLLLQATLQSTLVTIHFTILPLSLGRVSLHVITHSDNVKGTERENDNPKACALQANDLPVKLMATHLEFAKYESI